MKNVFKTIAVLAASLLAFGACQGELENPREQVEATHSVTFVAGAPETKTEAKTDGSTVNYIWKESDQEQADKPLRFHIFEGENEANEVIAELDEDGKMTITAKFSGTTPSSAVEYTGYFNSEIRSEQRADGTDYDQDSDVLIAKATSANSEGYIPFQFKRLGAIAEVTLKGLTGSNLLSVKIESLTSGVDLAGSFNGEEFVEKSKLITINTDNEIYAEGKATLRFVSLPVPAPGARLRFIVETLDSGVTHKYAKSFAEGASIDFSQGDLTPFSIAFGSQCEVSTTATFSINGAELPYVYAEGEKINFPPVAETISGFTFVGWTKTAINGTQDNAPDLVGTDNEVMGKGNVTYYAVYAKASGNLEVTNVITYNTTNIPTEYAAAKDYSLNGVNFNITQMYKNGEKMQWRAAGNSKGTGTMYNQDALKEIQSIAITYHEDDENKNFTVKVGNSANPTAGTDIPATQVEGTNTYCYDCSSIAPSYFVLANGSYAGYLTSIEITYNGGEITYSDYCTTVVTLFSIAVSGTPTKTTYSAGESFDPAGLTVTGTYSDNSSSPITEGISWTFTPSGALSAGTTSVSVTASALGKTSESYTVNGLTVNEKEKSYVKVTSSTNLTNGTYLIVCEDMSVAFNGALANLDAVSNTVDVTIADGKIAKSDAVDNAAFTFTASDGSFKGTGGKFFGNASNSNGLTSSDTALSNTVSISDGNADIVSTGGAYLRYNATSGQTRFRYYKSSTYTGQKAIQLYKLQ